MRNIYSSEKDLHFPQGEASHFRLATLKARLYSSVNVADLTHPIHPFQIL